MSKTTPNYGFILEDNAATKFKDWREAINGATNSNFSKVDHILAGKSDKSTKIECTLAAASWAGLSAPYTQELIVPGLNAVQDGSIFVSYSATFEQREAARKAKLWVIGQMDGKLTVSADGQMPVVDIPVLVILAG